MKKQHVVVEFKDSDFDAKLEAAGVDSAGVRKLMRKAQFREYWRLRLSMNPDGTIESAEFVKAK